MLKCRFTIETTRPSGGAATRALIDGVEYVKLSDLKGVKFTGTPTVGNDGGSGGGDEDDFVSPGA